MATRTQTQQTSAPKQQAQRQAAPQQAQAPVERTSNGERGLNRCFFIGRLGADPVMKYTSAGIAVTTASLAVKSYPTATKPDWIKLRFWRGAAETVNQYARKGSKLHVEGKLRVNTRADEQGVMRTYFVIDVDEFMFLGDSAGRGNGVAAAEELDEADLEGLDEIV
jgi:single-strand DNA-binding protein